MRSPTFAEQEPGAYAMLICFAVGILCFCSYCAGCIHGNRHGYAKRSCVDRGLEYESFDDHGSHRFARCLDRDQTPIIVKVW